MYNNTKSINSIKKKSPKFILYTSLGGKKKRTTFCHSWPASRSSLTSSSAPAVSALAIAEAGTPPPGLPPAQLLPALPRWEAGFPASSLSATPGLA